MRGVSEHARDSHTDDYFGNSVAFKEFEFLCDARKTERGERDGVKNENGIVFSLVSKDEAQAAELDELVEKTFEGSLPAFVAAFARKTKLSQDEVDRLRAMIDGYEEKQP